MSYDTNIRAIAKEEFDKHPMFKDDPMAWSAWKMAFDIAWNKSRENLSEELAKMVMPDGDIFTVCQNEYINEHSSLKDSYMTHYLKGAKMQRDYWQKLVIKP